MGYQWGRARQTNKQNDRGNRCQGNKKNKTEYLIVVEAWEWGENSILVIAIKEGLSEKRELIRDLIKRMIQPSLTALGKATPRRD